MRKSPCLIAAAAGLVLAAMPSTAQEAAPSRDRLGDLERKLDVLTQEIERLKLGEAAAEPQAGPAALGLAPAASKVCLAQPKRVSIGGYGEMVYQDFAKRRQDGNISGSRNEADFVRAILYAGYKFTDNIVFNSELEFEHGTTKTGAASPTSTTPSNRGEVSVEQAYLDFRIAKPFGVRAGMVLVPMGLVNESHEPTTFHGARRPSVESNVLPSTWRENGVGVFGEAGPISYRSYIVAGLQAVGNTGVTGFSGASGIRNGRSSGAKSYAKDKAWASRLDVSPVEGVVAGGSLYIGEADQDLLTANVPVTFWDLHARAEYRGAQLKAVYAEGAIGNADSVNQAQKFTNAAQNSVGSRLFGGYLEAAFDVLSLCPQAGGQSLSPFFRWERYDTQWRTPQAFAKNPANSRVEYTLGVTYKPIAQVAAKWDYQWMRNQARTGVNQWNLGLGYIF